MFSYFQGIGNPRGNENPFLLTFGVLWYRYHNYWAARVKSDFEELHPGEHISDERIFLEARKMVVGIYQVRKRASFIDFYENFTHHNVS